MVTSEGKYGGLLVEVGAGDARCSPTIGPTLRALAAKNGFQNAPGNPTNLHEVFENAVKRFGDRPCLGRRIDGKGDFIFETYKEVQAKVAMIGSAMAHVGVPAHGRAAVFSYNTPEWMMVIQACNRMCVYTIPLYDTLGDEAVEYCVHHSETTIIFVHTNNWAALSKSFSKLKDQVHTIIYWGSHKAVNCESATAQGMKVYSFKEFLALGEQNPREARPTKSEDLCTIMYTSGTTGMPKGVMIPQSMMLSCMGGMVGAIESVRGFTKPLNENDVMLSYLPLAHVFDRMIEEQVLANGASIGFYSGDTKAVIDDISALRPTLFIGVPRVYDRIHAGVIDQISKAGGLKKFLFNYGFIRKLKFIKQGYAFDKASPFFDKLVFSKIKQRLGGRVRGAISGGAPLSPQVEEFMVVALCCHFSQGYGLTETCGSSFLGNGEVGHFGTVGVPSTSIEFRLESIPEMKYDALAEVPRGEICMRGPMVFPGYYKDDEKTAEVLDKDGWFHTGDVGELNMESGGLKIIDRKKQIFKLSQGEYVAAEHIESSYKKLTLIAQIFVYGNSMENVLVAVVVPEEGSFMEAAKKAGLSGSFQEVVQQPAAKQLLLERMNATAKEAKLKGFEMIRGIILEVEAFSVENGLMTPTFKLKHHQLQEKYLPQITSVYKELNAKRT